MNKLKAIVWVVVWMIPAFLAGSSVGIYVYMSRLSPTTKWAMENEKYVTWAKQRKDVIYKAADMMYFDDSNKGVTIVKPTIMDLEK